MPTHRQKVAFQKSIENQGNVSKAMIEAGYSKSHAHNPQLLTNSKGFKKLLEQYAPEKSLVLKAVQMLDHVRITHKDFPAELGIERIKDIFKKANTEVLDILQSTSKKAKITVYYAEADTMTQDKVLDKLFRLHGLYDLEDNARPVKGLSLVDLFNLSEERRRHRNNT